jgi:hypothetical protein
MSFYGKDPEPKTTTATKRFYYLTVGSKNPDSVRAQQVYFYESGHVGFWNDTEDGDRQLVLAIKAQDVWEDIDSA